MLWCSVVCYLYYGSTIPFPKMELMWIICQKYQSHVNIMWTAGPGALDYITRITFNWSKGTAWLLTTCLLPGGSCSINCWYWLPVLHAHKSAFLAALLQLKNKNYMIGIALFLQDVTKLYTALIITTAYTDEMYILWHLAAIEQCQSYNSSFFQSFWPGAIVNFSTASHCWNWWGIIGLWSSFIKLSLVYHSDQ